MKVNKKRESGIELLRIILMIQIVFLHISDYGGYKEAAMTIGGITKVIYLGMWLLCRCPVPLLILLTGYFMVDREITLKEMVGKWISVHNTMWFYAISITLLCGVAVVFKVPLNGLPEMTKVECITAFFPFLNRTWFFMTNYLLVLFLAPFINIVLSRLDKKHYFTLVAGLFFLLTIWTSLTRIDGINEVISLKKVVVNESGKSLYMFLFLYILGGYIRMHIPEKRCEENSGKFSLGRVADWKWLIIFLGLWFINVLSAGYVSWYKPIYGQSDNPIVILQCVTLVLFFRSVHIYSPIINRVSRNNIGVYLIHEHYIMRNIIWASFPFLKTEAFYENAAYIFIIWGICLVVYLVCNLIEDMRAQLFICINKITSKSL